MGTITTKTGEEQVVVFQLSGQTYGIEIGAVVEIIRMETVTALPGTPDFVEGIINLRGRVIPVMDLRARFGLMISCHTVDSRIIIVETGTTTVGLIVDSVAEVLRFATANVMPPPAMLDGTDSDYLRGIILNGERMVILLDYTGILRAAEIEDLRLVHSQAAEVS